MIGIGSFLSCGKNIRNFIIEEYVILPIPVRLLDVLNVYIAPNSYKR
jgi:hypothetical protein